MNNSNFRFGILAMLYFMSGVAGLIFQVVWLYRLGLVFGQAAYATAATLTAFFIGLGLGGRLVGNFAERLARPLFIYGLLEIAIALSALLLVPGVEFYESVYPSLVELTANSRPLLILLKFIFSTALLLLPTILMGGTFPVLAHFVVVSGSGLAKRGSLLYACNTLGAATGTFLGGFYFMKNFGVGTTYIIAVLMALGVGAGSILLHLIAYRHNGIFKHHNKNATQAANAPSTIGLSPKQFTLLAFFSGLLALSAEVLWTQMFAQVLQNSVYSFAAILVVFLIALGVGGMLASVLIRKPYQARTVITVLLFVSALLIGLTPVVFNNYTDGLNYMAAGSNWSRHIRTVFGLAATVVFLPTVVLGTLFPYLLKVIPQSFRLSGKLVGNMVFLNSLGGATGPLLVGFVFLQVIGLWGTIKLVAMIYGFLALWFIRKEFKTRQKSLTWLSILLFAVILLLPQPPLVKLAPGQKLLARWQSNDGILTVVEHRNNLQLRLNNFYVLGDSRSALIEQMQGHIPLLIHPQPRRTLFLGMGTGITAGAALKHAVSEVEVVELVKNVIKAARLYYAPWANRLFEDDRVKLVPDDARNYVLGAGKKYDVIVGDLFTPWHAGTGSLYTVEHFTNVKAHLDSDGVFAQWLPLYQLTPESFYVILKTFMKVFPQTTLWRADFSGNRTSIALIGQEEGAKLSQEVLTRNIGNVIQQRSDSSNHMVGLFYLGNASTMHEYLADVPINTDDRRTIEFIAPIKTQQVESGAASFMVGKELTALLHTLQKKMPPSEDPYLQNLPPEEIRYVRAGMLYAEYLQLSRSGRQSEANKLLNQIRTLTPDFPLQ